jgi:hypothetical protein
MHGMGFKLGSKVSIFDLDVTGHIINIRRDKYNQPLYDVSCIETGKVYVARGYELDASLEATNESFGIQSKQ